MLALLLAVGGCLGAAITYTRFTSLLAALLATMAGSMAKLALDAIVQRDIPENTRNSAFARSETILQLSWVGGGALGLIEMPGTVGFALAALVVGAALVVEARALRRSQRAARSRSRPDAAGKGDRGRTIPDPGIDPAVAVAAAASLGPIDPQPGHPRPGHPASVDAQPGYADPRYAPGMPSTPSVPPVPSAEPRTMSDPDSTNPFGIPAMTAGLPAAAGPAPSGPARVTTSAAQPPAQPWGQDPPALPATLEDPTRPDRTGRGERDGRDDRPESAAPRGTRWRRRG
jgi:hypothetical protein